jgi:hypothetical protein
MTSNDLPEFEAQSPGRVKHYVKDIFGSSLLDVIEYEDGHYRAVFKSTYFTLHDDATEATKSQWNTLKKRMKRHNKEIFIFKEYGEVDCDMLYGDQQRDYSCLYMDFGFFKY